MANVRVALDEKYPTTNDPADQIEVLAGSLRDAGMKSLDHYSRKLPPWRHRIRQSLLPIIRWETPHLARIQSACRCDVLDSYFAMSANLGTHTFFMTALPICFWCGYTGVGRALVHMLALGVYWSGFFKDMLCLPRPLSPPLTRITMSGSAALEYGFPSTHSTNAVSVAVYFLYQLHAYPDEFSSSTRVSFLCLGYLYALSIMIGRMYCGMHGFFDVVVGSLLGLALGVLQLAFGDPFDDFVSEGLWIRPAIVIVVLMLAVRFHPEPADNCPCYDDSVSFAGVMAGIEVGHWHFAQTSYAAPNSPPSTVFFSMAQLGLTKTIVRVVGGVAVIFMWRAATKPFLLGSLPPVFRFIEKIGLTLPRRFFTQASEYKSVPPLDKDDNVIPPAHEIPHILSNLRRKRGVSIGPQSEADAREYIATREQRRRNSRSSLDDILTSPASHVGQASSTGYFSHTSAAASADEDPFASPASRTMTPTLAGKKTMLSPGSFPAQPLTPPLSDNGQITEKEQAIEEEEEEKRMDSAMFLALQKPRVRYDVEVVTKLVVYFGIGWLAVEGNPILFEITGLGLSGLR